MILQWKFTLVHYTFANYGIAMKEIYNNNGNVMIMVLKWMEIIYNCYRILIEMVEMLNKW